MKAISIRADDALEQAIEDIREFIAKDWPYKTVTTTDVIVCCIYHELMRIKHNN